MPGSSLGWGPWPLLPPLNGAETEGHLPPHPTLQPHPNPALRGEPSPLPEGRVPGETVSSCKGNVPKLE